MRCNTLLLRVLSISGIPWILGGCTLGPDFVKPPLPPVTTYTQTALPHQTTSTPVSGGNAQTFIASDIPLHWWKLFENPEISLLVEMGLKNHPSVESGKAAIRQATAQLKAQIGSTVFPQVDLIANAQRAKSATQSDNGFSAISNPYTLYNAQSTLSYTLDVFGKNRRAIEALCAQVHYEQYQLEGILLSLSSNIVNTAITRAALKAQIVATQELIALAEKTLDIVTKQYALGAAAKTDVLNQASSLSTLKATLPPLTLQYQQAEHALHQLVGTYPSLGRLPDINLDDIRLPAMLPISLPSTLVRHRPDIRAQEALMHAAMAQIGVAKAALFPDITLSAFVGWQSPSLHHFFNSQNLTWHILGGVAQPLFHGGALIAQKEEAVAAYEQSLANYKVTVLNAFQNVADTLSAIELDAVNLKAKHDAEMASSQSYILTEKQYALGATNYLNLLTAQRNYNQLMIERIQAQSQRYTDTVALFQALGGAWWTL